MQPLVRRGNHKSAAATSAALTSTGSTRMAVNDRDPCKPAVAMLCERMAPNLEKPTALTAEESLHFRVRRLIDAYNGPFGKILAGLIAEGQSEPAILQEFFGRWVSPRRNATIADLQRGKNAGELRSETEPELLNDAIFGAIYYRLLLRSGPLTRRFGEELVEQVICGHRSGNARS